LAWKPWWREFGTTGRDYVAGERDDDRHPACDRAMLGRRCGAPCGDDLCASCRDRIGQCPDACRLQFDRPHVQSERARFRGSAFAQSGPGCVEDALAAARPDPRDPARAGLREDRRFLRPQ
jgi:hypothetical protein